VIHRERLVDDTPHIRVSQADVELPSHVRFTQYVFRMRRCAMTAVLDDPGERVLLMRRHRFIVDRWVWELLGGYVDDGEDPMAAAAREVEKETGWRRCGIEFVMSCQPIIGNADYPQDLYLAHGAQHVGELEADEAAEVAWVPTDETPGMIARGGILGRSRSSGCSMSCCGGQAVICRCSDVPGPSGACVRPLEPRGARPRSSWLRGAMGLACTCGITPVYLAGDRGVTAAAAERPWP
jgi:8-oxo-dGDP phosphatase